MTAEGIEIIEVKSKKELDDFIRLPISIYSKDTLYVPPLITEMKKKFSKKNPFFLHASVKYFLAKYNGKPVGRVTSIINHRHNEFHKENTGFFGFFESFNNLEIAFALLDRVSETFKKEGMNIIRGPMNFSTNEESGFLLEGFDHPPMLMTPYNLPYYNELMEKYGMKKSKDLFAYIVDVPEELPEKFQRVAQIAARRKITVRPFNVKKFNQDMLIFKEVYNSAWENNWGFIPISDEELFYLGNSLKTILVPDLTLIAEKDGEPVGFMGLLPDFNFVLKQMNGKVNLVSILKALYYSKKIKDMRLLLFGIKAEYRNKGVDALLFSEGFRGVKKRNYKRVEFSWILEDNISVQRLIEIIDGKLYKKFRIYEKEL
ncbi:MAG: hypothetical protein IBX72_03395 [Nitrospirae bacterium]|nr:hypothetical protein [Nitrospirota bacterium]